MLVGCSLRSKVIGQDDHGLNFGGDWLHRIEVPNCMLSFPFGNVGGIDHVYCFHLGGGEFLLSPSVRTPGLLVIIVVQPLVLVFGIQLAGLFEHPTISVSVIGWFVGGAVNLARAVEYAVQTGRSQIVSFEWLFPLTRF